jgi:hypothetical protein
VDDVRLRRLTTLMTSAVFCQILAGATMRHTGAGLAIPDFPWMFGHVVPDHRTAGIAIHFGHRLGAGIVSLAIVSTVVDIWRRFSCRTELTSPSLLLLLLVATQVTLGAFVVVSHLQPWGEQPSSKPLSAERERERFDSRIEELDRKLSVDDWLRLSHQLIQSLFTHRPVAAVVYVEAVSGTGRLPVKRHAEPY